MPFSSRNFTSEASLNRGGRLRLVVLDRGFGEPEDVPLGELREADLPVLGVAVSVPSPSASSVVGDLAVDAEPARVLQDRAAGADAARRRGSVRDASISTSSRRRRTASSARRRSGSRPLFSEPNYEGRSTSFGGDNNELKNTPVGNDAAQSIRVECGQRRY